MADEKVDIVLKVKVHDRQLKELMAKIKAVEQMEKRLSSGSRMQNYANRMTSSNNKWKRSFDFVDTAVKMTGKSLTKVLGLAIKGVLIEMALLSAALIGIHALFVAGRFLHKAYSAGMSLIAGGAALAGAAIATVSAAIREQQAAMFAYRGKGASQFGSAMNQTRMAMRNLQSDASLASLGVETLNKAFGVMSKSMSVNQINASGKAIKALMDFGAAGQDPAQSIEAVATVVAALSDQKKGINDVIGAAQKLGPEMQKALKDAKVKTKKDFEDLLFSGKLAEMGGVVGQFDAVNNTLINVLKSYFTRLRGSFADFGDQFLEPLKVAFDEVFYIIKDGLAQMSVTIQRTLGVNAVTGGVVSMVEKTTNFFVRMLREYLPGVVGMFKKVGEWWDRFTRGWNMFFDKLRPFQDGARSLYKALEPIWEAIKRGAQNLTLFNELLQDNEGTAVETGQRIADLIDTISQLFFNLKKIFFEIAPFLNDVLAGLNQILKMITGIMTAGAGKGFMSALAPLLAMNIIGRKMGATKGGFMPNYRQGTIGTVNLQAGTVHLTSGSGQISQRASYGPGTATGGLSSGSVAGGGQALSSGALMSGGRVGPQLFQYQRGMDLVGFRAIRSAVGLGALGSVGQGAKIMTRTMPMEASRQARAADLARAQADRSAQYQRIANMQQQMVINQTPGFMSPALRAQMEKDMKRDIRRMEREANKNYARTRRQIRLKAIGQNITYGARGAIGGIRGGMSYLSGAAFDPVTGELTNPEAARDDARQRYQKLTTDRSGKLVGDPRNALSRRVARMRAIARINRTQTRFGMGMQRFSKSAGGQMGTAMGLGLLSQYAPEEMRGAMALGGMASMIDPRLGIAVAGVGGALTAKSAGAGALSGAAGGAAIGSMLGPAGAAVGAGIGLVVGGIMGSIRAGQEKLKQARLIGEESIQTFYAGLASAASKQFDRNARIAEAGGRPAGRGAFRNLAGTMRAERESNVGRLVGMAQGLSPQELFYNAYLNQGSLGMTISKGQFSEIYGMSVDKLEEYLQSPESGVSPAPPDMGTNKAIENFFNTQGVDITGDKPKVTKEFQAYSAGQATIDRVNETRMKELERISGKSGAELELLAKQLGVNLYNPMTKFTVLVDQLGIAVVRTADEMQNALADSLLAASATFRTAREQRDAIVALDQASQGLADQLASGNLGEFEKTTAVESYFEQYAQLALSAAGGDSTKALIATMGSFEAGPEGGVYAPGQVFAGQYETINPIYQRFASEAKKGVGQEYAGQLQAQLAEAGFSVDLNQASRLISQMDKTQLERFINLSNRGALINPNFNYTDDQMKQLLGSSGLGGLTLNRTPEQAVNEIANQAELLGQSAENLDASTLGLKTAIEDYNKQLDAFFTGPMGGKPEWWSKEAMAAIMGGDTSTPRGDTTSSRLSQTMSRHAAFDSMLTGNRTVTSSYRNFGLGSINSDHVMGRAYDLTGQNLGQYAKLVHDNGGFAEFHGTMANRHLHVVPGVGDTAMPAMPMMTTNSGGGGGGTTNYYNIEINGTNQSPEQIANMVVAKIDQRERSYSERI